MSAEPADCILPFEDPGSPLTASDLPAMAETTPQGGLGYHAGALVADDFLNQALYAAWRGGVLCYSASDLGSLQLTTSYLGLLLGVEHTERLQELVGKGESNIIIRTVPEKQPLAVLDGPHDIDILVEELRRAMGEVPFARFLQNCSPGDRPLVARLLQTNRLFVSPAKDRIDLAENYPLTGERLRLLLHAVRTCVEESGGYAPLARVQGALEAAELGGSFLTDHLLLDVLRRHGGFEILSGTVVADPALHLGPFLQRIARDILRARVAGLTFQQIVAERPELAEFSTCLQGLLEADPLVQSEDGLHYQLA